MGTAVHTIGEHKIKTGEELEFEDVFFPLVRAQRKIEPDTTQWLAGGPKDAPFMGQKVVDMGKACVENYFKFLERFTVQHVEYDVSGYLPGCEPQVKGFIDLVGEHDDWGFLLVDTKTSAAKPKNDLQLQTYSALWAERHGGVAPNGFWLMLRPDAKPKTNKARFVDMSELDIGELGRRYQAAYEKMQEKLYPALSSFCDFCTQRPNCLVQSGPTDRATFYDRSERDGIPF